MLRYICLIASAAIGALITAFIAWGLIVLFFPSMNIDTAFNVLVIFLILGGIAGFMLRLRLSKKTNRPKTI
jgi:high-affinity Fe2+/Pb2+ permease